MEDSLDVASPFSVTQLDALTLRLGPDNILGAFWRLSTCLFGLVPAGLFGGFWRFWQISIFLVGGVSGSGVTVEERTFAMEESNRAVSSGSASSGGITTFSTSLVSV